MARREPRVQIDVSPADDRGCAVRHGDAPAVVTASRATICFHPVVDIAPYQRPVMKASNLRDVARIVDMASYQMTGRGRARRYRSISNERPSMPIL